MLFRACYSLPETKHKNNKCHRLKKKLFWKHGKLDKKELGKCLCGEMKGNACRIPWNPFRQSNCVPHRQRQETWGKGREEEISTFHIFAKPHPHGEREKKSLLFSAMTLLQWNVGSHGNPFRDFWFKRCPGLCDHRCERKACIQLECSVSKFWPKILLVCYTASKRQDTSS